MKKEVQIDVQDLDHLGIIAGIVDDIGIVEIIDKEIGTDIREKVSAGQVVKAMIINCMGFLTAPLYLFSEFFEGLLGALAWSGNPTAAHPQSNRTSNWGRNKSRISK